MLERILIALITQAGSALLTWVMSKQAKKAETAIAETAIDAGLAEVKAAVSEALDGKPVTKEQRAKLNRAFADLVRGTARGL